MLIKYCKTSQSYHGVAGHSGSGHSVLGLAPPVDCCSKVAGFQSRTLSGDTHQALECVNSGPI